MDAPDPNDLTEWLAMEQRWLAISKQLTKTRECFDHMFRLHMAGAGVPPTAEMKKYYRGLEEHELEARLAMNEYMYTRMDEHG